MRPFTTMQAIHRTSPLVAVVAALAFVVAPAAHAQAKPAAAAASAAAPVVVIDAEKQKLIDHVLTLMHPENNIVMMVEQPATRAMDEANVALHQAGLTQDKIDKAMADIHTDVQKYLDTAMPIAVASAKKNMSPALSPLFAQNLTNDDLRMLISYLESPARQKTEKMFAQMNRSLAEKVVGDVGAEVNKNVKAMQQTVGTKLQAAATVK